MNNMERGILKKFNILNYSLHSNGWIEIFDSGEFQKVRKHVSENVVKPKIMYKGEKIKRGTYV